MEVFALSGPSGTGKSTSALFFAHQKNIPAIIDDGLLIYKGQKVAGTSAKYEKNYITAVKRATFFYKDHTREVRDSLQELSINKLLIVGTSVKMVNLIASKLDLDPINHYVDIEKIRSSNEIKMALFVRKTQGKHVIPIPYVQVEQNVFRKLISKGIKIFSSQKEVIGETTIVQPNFQTGSIFISPEVLKKIVSTACELIPEIDSCGHIKIDLENIPHVTLHLSITVDNERDIVEVGKHIQGKIHRDFLQYLNIELYSVDINLTKLTFNAEHRH